VHSHFRDNIGSQASIAALEEENSDSIKFADCTFNSRVAPQKTKLQDDFLEENESIFKETSLFALTNHTNVEFDGCSVSYISYRLKGAFLLINDNSKVSIVRSTFFSKYSL